MPEPLDVSPIHAIPLASRLKLFLLTTVRCRELQKGIAFLSVEDETGIGNVVVMPDLFDANRVLIVTERWLLVEDPIQDVDNVIHVRAKRIEPLGSERTYDHAIAGRSTCQPLERP
jgi:DNA polymerase III alpha subunit